MEELSGLRRRPPIAFLRLRVQSDGGTGSAASRLSTFAQQR